MKSFGKMVWALLTALIVAVGVKVFEDPIRQTLGISPLQAEIRVVDWKPLPPEFDEVAKQKGDKFEITAPDNERYVGASRFATVILTNKSTESTSNIQATFDDDVFAEVAFPEATKEVKLTYGNPIKVGSLRPGESAKIFVWASTTLGFFQIEEKIKINSDKGKFKTKIRDENFEYYEYSDDVYDAVDWIFAWILWIALIISSIGFFILMIVNHSYYIDLLSSDDFYVKEKLRFEKEYKNFNIDQKNLGKYAKKFLERKSSELE